ncbi:C6 zinc finger protein domain-containing protein [Teratosphaeria destructans]|uniref:C6 zinc finger protein domain-containing protein n=1 Tax=Teratosphaeria destructans TaxID=418781 RepID=A0A9W7W308_9PEZI|nr:C6 zinc finger protein domain-containing protein [Teratosphaeria destructans]
MTRPDLELHQRKTRCDKRHPRCSACERAGLQCVAVQRQRLPRGKSGNAKRDDPAVKARIARLESLVIQLQQQVNHGPSSNDAAVRGLANMSIGRPQAPVHPEHSDDTPSPQPSTTSALGSEHIAWTTGFWEQLSGAVDGLREVLESPEEDETDIPAAQLHTTSPTGSPGFCVGMGHRGSMMLTSPHVSAEVREELLHTYADRIDPIYKAVHWPSVRTHLRTSTFDARSPSMQALELSICFIAVCALGDGDVQDRTELLEHYRTAAQRSIERAGIISNKDLAVLQALTLYLEGLRMCQRNDEFWLLVAVAVRAATDHGLDQLNDVPPSQRTTFDYQVKKRLWFCVGILDLQASFDRPCRTLLFALDFVSQPLDANDDELESEDRLQEAALRDSVGLSEDMIFTFTICASTVCQRRLGECIAYSTAGNPEDAYNEKMGFIAEHEAFVQKLKHLYPDEKKRTHIQRFAIAVASDVGNSMALFVRRPMQKQTGTFRPPQRDATEILAIGTGVLESWVLLKDSPEFAKYMWLVWVPWQALAVTLAELCGPHQGPAVDRAWRAVMPAYEKCSRLVTKGRSEWLWRPIVAIMRRAKTVRAAMGFSVDATQQKPTSIRAATDVERGVAGSERDQLLTTTHGTAAFPLDPAPTTESMYASNLARPHSDAYGPIEQSLSTPDGPLEYVPQPWEQPLDPALDWTAGLDTDDMAWTNWETFVDELYRPTGWPG